MDYESAKLIGAGLTMIGLVGPGVGIGTVVNGMLHAQGRNPEARGELFTNMILGIVFCESIAIYSMVIAFIILFVL
ncbi:MAG: ATP synthase F0 subunit C [Chloroflexi bacterium]|nr:ATP synthase F0 subunit C [Chloroflexota bacterium]